ncbi:Chaperone protein YajL [Clostridiales bacterium CHKCI001]|nr:Chaperone protein YajL [Clostridiales bacterium CHKCI001]
MNKVYAFLADGFEEVEALAVIDILRRADVDVTTFSIMDDLDVKGAHNIVVKADKMIDDADWEKADLLFLPGGMPGTLNLAACDVLTEQVKQFFDGGKRIAAICAAPSVLGELHILKGKKATCYPGFEDKLLGAEHVTDGVITDGTVTTARGMGYAVDLGLELVKLLIGQETSDEIRESIQYNY